MRTILLLVVVLTSLWASSASAQARDSLAANTRVRVLLTPQEFATGGIAPRQSFIGTLAAVSPDSLTVQVHPGVAPVSLGWSAVRRLDRSQGVPTRAQSALRIGVYGAAQSALAWYVLNGMQKDPLISNTNAALIGGGLGAAFGAYIGARYPVERWRRVPLTAQTAQRSESP